MAYAEGFKGPNAVGVILCVAAAIGAAVYKVLTTSMPIYGCILLGLIWLFLFRFRNNIIHGISISKRTLLHVSDCIAISIPIFQPDASRDRHGRPRRIFRQIFPKRTRILSILSKPHSFHSVHCAIGRRMNGMIVRSFRKRNSFQKNANTVYSEYSYSGIVPKERASTVRNPLCGQFTFVKFTLIIN